MSTYDRIAKIIVGHLGVRPDKVTAAAHLVDDLGADSLDMIELVMALEQEFDIEIQDDAADRWHTVGDVVAGVDALEAAARARPPRA